MNVKTLDKTFYLIIIIAIIRIGDQFSLITTLPRFTLIKIFRKILKMESKLAKKVFEWCDKW